MTLNHNPHEPFVTTIQEALDRGESGDAERAVYADWLQEQNDEESEALANTLRSDAVARLMGQHKRNQTMTPTQVKALTPKARLLYFIKERTNITLRRRAGRQPPWTDDPILQTYWFTNPKREWDKTTVWFRENVRGPLADDPAVIQATLVFRWFNRISTGGVLQDNNLLTCWDSTKAVSVLEAAPKPLFTAAYVISAPTGMSKLRGVCLAIDRALATLGGANNHDVIAGNLQTKEGRVSPHTYWKTFGVQSSLQEAHRRLCRLEYLGPFMAYELIRDLRYTYLLRDAPDILTWCNPGPGCLRGLRRYQGITPQPGLDRRTGNMGWMYAKVKPEPGDMAALQGILQLVRTRLAPQHADFEMSDVVMSCCELDKYDRILFGQGTSKKYTRNRSGT